MPRPSHRNCGACGVPRPLDGLEQAGPILTRSARQPERCNAVNDLELLVSEAGDAPAHAQLRALPRPGRGISQIRISKS